MKKLLRSFKKLNIYLQIILLFCLVGFGKNVYLFLAQGGDTADGYRLFGGFALIFGSQAALLLMRDRRAALFSAAQVLFAVFLYEDFTFLPVVKPVFYFFMYSMANISFEGVYNLQYVMVALLCSLEILKTYLIYDFLTPSKNDKKC